jgi:hypothetical protein
MAFNNFIASNGTLIQRGEGTGPVKPRQPFSNNTLADYEERPAKTVPNPADGDSGR